MRRRHLLALIILAFVVATVLAMGPVRVWDWMTLWTVEEYYPNGALHRRYKLRWQEPREGYENFRERYVEWYPNGEREREYLGAGPGFRHGRVRERWWDEEGRLFSCLIHLQGKPYQGFLGFHGFKGNKPFSAQFRYTAGEMIEMRTSPPWFTEEEILQSVEGVEE